jgi:large subunit ribosomal protein L11
MALPSKRTGTMFVRMLIPAGKASPSPPVGPVLGQRGVKSMDFCKQFNDRTKDYLPEIPIRVHMLVKSDKTFTFDVMAPPTSWLLKRAAGIEKGSDMTQRNQIGEVTVKQIYEIAKIKHQDDNLKHMDIQHLCRAIIGSARSMGIKVVRGTPDVRPGPKPSA